MIRRLSITAIAAATVLLGTGAAPAGAATAKTYKSCRALNKAYPKGVAKKAAKDKAVKGHKAVTGFKVNTAVYNKNKKLDTDHDGIACEKTGAALPKPYSPHQLLSITGSGNQNSVTFTTGADPFTVAYTFDCTGWGGGAGNMVIWLTNADGSVSDLAANDLALSGGKSYLAYDARGTYHLEIESECAWTAQVVG